MLEHVLTLCHSANCCPEIHLDREKGLFVLTDDFGARIEVEPSELASSCRLVQPDVPADRRTLLQWPGGRSLQMSGEQYEIFRDELQAGGVLDRARVALV